jgi:predicted Rossmann fold nucleotide-binding protein DprA/Smf involved in DNA uptake
MPSTVTAEQIEILVDAYVSKGNVAEAATAANISRTLAYYYLGHRGFDFTNTPPLAELSEKRGEGFTYEQLAEYFGVSVGTIHNWLSQLQMAGTRARTMGSYETAEESPARFE